MATDPSNRPRLHPLLGTAAVAVIVACAVGVYAMLRPPVIPPVAPTIAAIEASAPSPASAAVPPAPVASVPVEASAVSPAPASAVAPVAIAPASVPAVAPVPVHRPRPRPKVVQHRPAPTPEDPALYNNLPGYAAQPGYCPNCGTVVAIQAMQVAEPTSGLGGLGGAAVGGLVGNQFGRGSGRTAMTVLGALGGAFAGNSVEQNMNRRVVYRMVVHYEDGTNQTFTQDQPFPFGQGEGVRMVNGVLYRR